MDDALFRVNEELVAEIRQYLENERSLREMHNKRIAEILQRMEEIAKKKPLE